MNRFGQSTYYVAKSFATLGAPQVLPKDMYQSTTTLFMFAHMMNLKGHILKPNQNRKWASYKLPAKFNVEFDNYDQEKFDKIQEFLTRLEVIEQANKEMRIIQNYIKTWIKKGQVLKAVPEDDSIVLNPMS